MITGRNLAPTFVNSNTTTICKTFEHVLKTRIREYPNKNRQYFALTAFYAKSPDKWADKIVFVNNARGATRRIHHRRDWKGKLRADEWKPVGSSGGSAARLMLIECPTRGGQKTHKAVRDQFHLRTCFGRKRMSGVGPDR